MLINFYSESFYFSHIAFEAVATLQTSGVGCSGVPLVQLLVRDVWVTI